MKLLLNKVVENFWYYNKDEIYYSQKQYNYIFKHLNFEKLEKNELICFKDKEIQEWFYKAYINRNSLKDIYNYSPEGYQWLKNHWGKGVFKLYVYYTDKQELKTIVNKIINVEFKK